MATHLKPNMEIYPFLTNFSPSLEAIKLLESFHFLTPFFSLAKTIAIKKLAGSHLSWTQTCTCRHRIKSQEPHHIGCSTFLFSHYTQ